MNPIITNLIGILILIILWIIILCIVFLISYGGYYFLKETIKNKKDLDFVQRSI